MRIARSPFGLLSYVLAAAFVVGIVGCDTTGNDPDPPNIGGDELEVEGGRGTTVEVPLTLRAEAGIQSLTVSLNGGTPETVDVDAGVVEQQLTYVFEIPPASTVGTEYALLFTLTDTEGEETTISATVTTGKLIETPETYEFTRDGESTVSYSGQTDRLNMVAEMKAYLRNGDNGQILSEQALLDMFENAGGNGGGHFSFSSDRQLKDKTFAPDLDARLFEDLFAEAAAASQNGNAGVTASNGTAGLIARGNGNTILVDENGREFVQLIEKGLMGAVFYNQIYNVYLTDARIGESVENVELVDGRNYTPMEHHWDEAFGYFDAPLDFTSPWPEARRNELRYWNHYSNVVDNVEGGLLGTNKTIMDAFIEGRTAIVNNDPSTKNAQRAILYEALDLVAAATAVHYINDTLGHLNAGSTGDALHTLSEAWAFVNALRYNPERRLSLDELDDVMNKDFGADGNFWNVTPAGLNEAKSALVDRYPELAPVQDAL